MYEGVQNRRPVGPDMAWSDMDRDCLENIAGKIITISDYWSFRLVCHDWASAVPKLPRHHVSIPPLLMLLKQQQQKSEGSKGNNSCRFINVCPDDNTNNFHWHSTQFLEGLPPDHRVIGSSHGFLIVVSLTGEIVCLNLISKKQVTLPALSEFPDVEQFTLVDNHEGYRLYDQFGYPQNISSTQMRDWYLKKIILSSSPADGADFMAIAIIQSGNQIAYCKRGDKSWKFIPLNIIPDAHRSTEDIVYCNGLLSGLSYGLYGDELTICNFTSSNPTTFVIDAKIPREESDIKVHDYLVISEDDDNGIFLVSRCMSKGDQKLSLYRFDATSCSWASQETLNGKLVFLGLNSCLSFQASDFHGCEENTIYFLGDSLEQKDMGMFKLSDQRIESLPCFPEDEDPSLWNSHPIWFAPNPW